jgi:hypothetical protein
MARKTSTEETLEEVRKHTKPSDHHSKQGGMHKIAVMSETEHINMINQCGNDPEKHDAYLRDRPQLLTAKPRQCGLPPKRRVFYPGMKRR